MGSVNVILEPWSKRGKEGGINKVIAMVDEISSKYQEAVIFSINPPAIQGLGESSGLQMMLLDINSLGTAEMAKALDDVTRMAEEDPRIKQVTSLFQGTVPQYQVKIDRDRIKLLGVMMEDVYSAMAAYLGGSYVNDFVEFGRTYQVTVQANGIDRSRVGDVLRLSVKNSSGEMVPFSTFATIESTMGARVCRATTCMSLPL